MPLALGVLISGRGSNLMAILDAIDLGKLDASVKVVVSNKANAAGLVRARERGVETVFLDPK
ncbi:MAG: formyltransferase family protein, partial [Nitrospirales bacterium]